MRVTATLRARVEPGERGAIAVIVAIVLVLLMSLVAYALDTGNAWQTRRALVTATDAAALAAAATYAEGGNGCGGVAASYATANVPDATVTGCAFTTWAPGAGYVTVSARTPWHMNFAGIMGFGDRDIHSTTTAAYGQPLGLTGLRPLALCSMSAGYQQWVSSGLDTPFVVTIPYAKSSPGDCGANVPGNWGVQDFDGGANSNRDTKDWVESGYPGLVTAPGTIPGDTGAFSNSLRSALDYLVSSQLPFQLPVYDAAAGNGSDARFHVVDFVSVRLQGYEADGAEATRWLRIEFVSAPAQGTCCAHDTDTGTRVVFICAVDASFPSSNCADR